MLTTHSDRMDSSMPPPQRWLSWIHAQYSALGLPRKPSVYVSGLPATASAMIFLQRHWRKL